MSDVKHTPWRFEPEDGQADQWVFGSDGEFVATVDGRFKDDPQAIVHARLICAAPELLEAARLFVAYDSAPDDTAEDFGRMMLAYADALAAAKSAIAKAEGRA
jgi:hypothetical protein